jgi:hypothetical protein
MFSTQDGYIWIYCNNTQVARFTQNQMYLLNNETLTVGAGIDLSNEIPDNWGSPLYLNCGDGAIARSQLCYFQTEHSPGVYYRLWVARNGVSTYAYVQDTSGWKASCSKTLKQDIQILKLEDFKIISDQFNQVPLYKYERKDTPDKQEIGFISEDTPEIMGSDGYGMSPIKTIGFLAAVGKYRDTKLDSQKQTISKQQEKILLQKQEIEGLAIELENIKQLIK